VVSITEIVGSEGEIITISRRVMASRGPLAWMVPRDPVMPRVHRLQHIEGPGAAHFTEDDPVRPHAQCVAEQVAHRDLVLAPEFGWTRLEAAVVRQLQIELGGILDSDDSLLRIDHLPERVSGA
jgi:hypothetical protein